MPGYKKLKANRNAKVQLRGSWINSLSGNKVNGIFLTMPVYSIADVTL